MSLTRVMIVDDEILAIDFLKSTMPWNKYGYQLVAQATTVRKGFELFKNYQPEIVILDIKMPEMNGLEFSKKLFALNRQVKIILLTSYRDFDYVKQALELGISGYILKHEINESVLASQLDKARKALDDDIRSADVIRKHLIRKLLENKKLNDTDLLRIKDNLGNTENGLILLLVKTDTGYPIFSEIMQDSPEIENGEINWDLCEYPDGLSCCDLSYISQNRWYALLTLDRFCSEKEVMNMINLTAHRLQSAYRACSENTVSILSSHPFFKIEDLPLIYSRLSMDETYIVFFGKEKIIQWNQLNHGVIGEKSLFEDSAGLKKDLQLLRQEIADCLDLQVGDLLSKIFRYSLQPEYNLAALKKICHELLMILEQFYDRNGMSFFKEFLNTNKSNVKLYSVGEIRLWFVDRFVQAIRFVKNLNIDRYSNKIRQVIAYVREHYSNTITLEYLGDLTGLSGDRLRHLFKEETGVTIAEYITQYRIEMSEKLLQKGTYKVFEVATMVGFNSSQYFSQVFRKITGINPLDFTKMK